MANERTSRDDNRADSKPANPRQPYGKTYVDDQTKCREQVELGKYPKRRSDDQY